MSIMKFIILSYLTQWTVRAKRKIVQVLAYTFDTLQLQTMVYSMTREIGRDHINRWKC